MTEKLKIGPSAASKGQRRGDFYPASGFRWSGSGAQYDVGSGGYAWSSSSYSAPSVSSSFLVFYSSYVGSEDSNSSRAHGFPVRCVQE